MKTNPEIKIHHNQSCSKSCAAVDLLKNNGFTPEIISYLDNTPSKDELIAILDLLKLTPIQLIRTKEPLYKQKFEGLTLPDEEWIAILVENPILIERPIIIKGNRAVIGRPTERILEILD